MESQIIEVIGHLTKVKSQHVRETVRQVFGGSRDWKATLRQKLGPEGALDDLLHAQKSTTRQTLERAMLDSNQ